MICFLGMSHAPQTLAAAARKKNLDVTDDPAKADVIFIAEDTPTNANGERDLGHIRALVGKAAAYKATLVLSSQVPPGFTRSLGLRRIVHMAETLRIKDAMERALHPEQFIFGVNRGQDVPMNLLYYAWAHGGAKVCIMSWEEAEFAKIAINMFLAAQVDTTNRLSAAAAIVGADWKKVCDALRCDKRIGSHAYLTPGRWQDSTHLMRDSITLEEIIAR